MKTTFKNKHTRSSRSLTKKHWLIGGGIIAGILVLLLVLGATNVINLPFFGDDDSEQEQVTESNGINLDPPTQEELDETEQHKKDLANQDQTPTNNGSGSEGKKQASVFITAWGHNTSSGNAEVSGYVTGVYEEGGTCTATYSKSGTTVTESRSTALDASTISCGFISVPVSELSPGNWTVTLSYSSQNAEGTSEPVTLEVK